jgi:ABC-type uncharacterized transport system permease subunit
MFSGITTFCFAASYTVALLLESSRLVFRSGVRGALLLGFAAAGLLAHTLFLVHRAWYSGAAPLSSEYDWYLVAAWVLAVVYLYLTLQHPRTAVGLFVVPLVLALIGCAHFADRASFPQTKASQIWGMIHGGFLLLGTVAVLTGFVAGMMHLVHSYRLKHKVRPAQGFQLPSLEHLERTNITATRISAILLLIGFLSGVVLNAVNRRQSADEYVPWTDPVIWSSGLLLIWLVAAAVFSLVYKPARQGRKVAYLTVASFLFLALALGVRLLVPTRHAPERPARNVERENLRSTFGAEPRSNEAGA